MITLHTLESPAAKEAYLAARRTLAAYVKGAEAFAADSDADSDERTLAAAIADALRNDALSALRGRVPTVEVRHLPNMSGKVRSIAADIGTLAADADALCPILAADGVTPTEAQASRQRNGRSAVTLRGTTERCPVCLAADVVRTLTRDGAEARDADAKWNRRGA